MEKKSKWISNIIFIAIIVIALMIFAGVYGKYNFNDYIKTEYQRGNSVFIRDGKVKYNNNKSYAIFNTKDYNDAMFYRTISVEPDTLYRITCMVKTEDVVTKKENSTAGANICIVGALDKSKSLTETNDWQELELLIDSKKQTELKVGFRLGGNEDECMGKAWFSDFKIQIASRNKSDSTWKFGMFLIDSVEVELTEEQKGQSIKVSMKDEEKQRMLQNFERFGVTIKEMSQSQIEPELYTYEIKEPITKISYDEKNGYYFEAKDVEEWIEPYLEKQELDHIFIVVKMGDSDENKEIPVKDWIGLGAMEYEGIGFSNIRIPNDTSSGIYQYNVFYNQFPEEVMVHEFLHSLEKDLKDREYDIPALHDYERYGYENQKLVGLKDWYRDYMRKQIATTTGEFIGLEPEVYYMQPVQKSDFAYSYQGNQLKEPANIIEEIISFIHKIQFIFSKNKE